MLDGFAQKDHIFGQVLRLDGGACNFHFAPAHHQAVHGKSATKSERHSNAKAKPGASMYEVL